MKQKLFDSTKNGAGFLVSKINRQCHFERTTFILAHMRCGSTALSNVICNHKEITGFGEAHIAYRSEADLGVLTMSQLRRKSWDASARYLFDKLLHSKYDYDHFSALQGAKLIFVVRDPFATLMSIRNLFQKIGSQQYSSYSDAADYYIERVRALTWMWENTGPSNRIALSHALLMTDPEAQLDRITKFLELKSPILNQYPKNTRSLRHGVGDPLASHQLQRIETRKDLDHSGDLEVDLPDGYRQKLAEVYNRFQKMAEI